MTHRIEWTLEAESCHGTVICDESVNADCRMYCPKGCEQIPCHHEGAVGWSYSFSKTCNVVEWLSDGSVVEFYDGPETKPVDGPIVPVWDGDGFMWHYPKAAS